MLNRLSFCCLLFLVPVALEAGGESGASFLKIKNSTRAMALGGAFVSLADDISCLQWNPAGLSLLDVPVVEFNHRKSFDDMRYEHLAWGSPLPAGNALGLGIYYSAVDDLFQIDDIGLGTPVQAYDFVGTLGYSRRLFSDLSLGVNAKCYYSYLIGSTAGGAAFDLGVLYSFLERFRAGLSFLNLGPGIKYERVADPLPRWCKVGLTAYLLNRQHSSLSFSLEGNQALLSGPSPYLCAGMEYSAWRTFFGRVGYRLRRNNSALTYGAGVKHVNVVLNYAYSAHEVLGGDHSASLGYEFRMRGRRPEKGSKLKIQKAKEVEIKEPVAGGEKSKKLEEEPGYIRGRELSVDMPQFSWGRVSFSMGAITGRNSDLDWSVDIIDQTGKSLKSCRYRRESKAAELVDGVRGWALEILDGKDRIIETRDPSKEWQDFAWDCSDKAGVKLPLASKLSYKLSSYDANGKYLELPGPVLAMEPPVLLVFPGGRMTDDLAGCEIRFQAALLASVTSLKFVVLDKVSQQRVRTMDFTGKAPASFYWDGKNDNGVQVSLHREYSVWIAVIDRNGNSQVVTNDIAYLSAETRAAGDIWLGELDFNPENPILGTKGYLRLKKSIEVIRRNPGFRLLLKGPVVKTLLIVEYLVREAGLGYDQISTEHEGGKLAGPVGLTIYEGVN